MPSKEQQQESGTEDKLQQWKDLGVQSQRVISAFIERQKGGDGFSVSDPKSIGNAFMKMNAQLLADPMKLAEAQQQLWKDSLLLWQNTMRRMAGQEVEPVVKPETGDRRFKKAAWDEELTSTISSNPIY